MMNFIMMESQSKNFTVLVNSHHEFKIMKNMVEQYWCINKISGEKRIFQYIYIYIYIYVYIYIYIYIYIYKERSYNRSISNHLGKNYRVIGIGNEV